MPVENCSPLCEFARGAQRRSCGGRPPDRLKTDKARILTPLGFFANSAWKSVPFGMPLLLQVTKGKTRGALFGMTLLFSRDRKPACWKPPSFCLHNFTRILRWHAALRGVLLPCNGVPACLSYCAPPIIVFVRMLEFNIYYGVWGQ